MTGIYMIRNKSNGMIYIGKSKNIMSRWCEHMRQGENATKYEDEFHFELYNNPTQFDFSIIELCNENELAEKEAFYIKKYDSINFGYNRIAAATQEKQEKVKAKEQIMAVTNKDIVNKLNDLCGKPLFVEDKKKLAIFMGYRDTRGNLLGWPTVKRKLIQNGFEIKETKRNVDGHPRNCSIISIKYKY